MVCWDFYFSLQLPCRDESELYLLITESHKQKSNENTGNWVAQIDTVFETWPCSTRAWEQT